VNEHRIWAKSGKVGQHTARCVCTCRCVSTCMHICYLCIPPAPNEACMFVPQAAFSLIFHPEYNILYFLINYYYYYSNEGTLSLVKVMVVRERQRYYEGWCNSNAAYTSCTKKSQKFFLKRLLVTMNEQLKIRTHINFFALYFFIFNTHFIWQVNT